MNKEELHRLISESKGNESNICQICGSSDHAEGHHILDYAFSGAADKDNIITLCHDHHQKVHKGLIDIFKF